MYDAISAREAVAVAHLSLQHDNLVLVSLGPALVPSLWGVLSVASPLTSTLSSGVNARHNFFRLWALCFSVTSALLSGRCPLARLWPCNGSGSPGPKPYDHHFEGHVSLVSLRCLPLQVPGPYPTTSCWGSCMVHSVTAGGVTIHVSPCGVIR